jgi:sporulation protein YtfJ
MKMSEKHPIEGLMGVTMEKIKNMVDVDTIIGTPVTLADGTTIIPVSKVSFGFGSGGSDLPAKVTKDLFGGGTGAGVSIQPVAFIVVTKGDVKLLQMSMNATTSNAVVNMIPEIFDKISGIMGSQKDDKNSEE